jgi:hypothetical protein
MHSKPKILIFTLEKENEAQKLEVEESDEGIAE